MSCARSCDVEMQIPGSAPGTTERVHMRCSGDCAAAHAGWALMTPVWYKGCCFRCTAPKSKWLDDAAIAAAWKRNFVYQCVANHINPWPFLPGRDANGKLYSERPPPECPHCDKTLDEALKQQEADEWAAADTTAKRNKIIKLHADDHAGGVRAARPVLPIDNRHRSRGVLHRRMNVASNCMMATVLRVPFSEQTRLEANALLRTHKMIWRFPETRGKRAKTISAGNDSRRLFSNPALLVGLLRIFYEDADEHADALELLGHAAAANDAVRTEEGDGATEAAPASSSAPQRRQATKGGGVQGGGVAKKKSSKKKVMAVLAPPWKPRKRRWREPSSRRTIRRAGSPQRSKCG
mmetsp:Transcript_14817/g.38251  ORF Transcript_14817/g.38251 Transcript_14817/m.38251 type:complete len:351 (+) Transcript_14817:92-1144(+)